MDPFTTLARNINCKGFVSPGAGVGVSLGCVEENMSYIRDKTGASISIFSNKVSTVEQSRILSRKYICIKHFPLLQAAILAYLHETVMGAYI